jgi:pyruvate/2-oxoglutarate dehydrogenase complex dihydrolipoamide dehydrogenase (E3) component
VAATLTEVLTGEGIEIRTGVVTTAVAGTAGAIELTLADGSTVAGSHLLLAAGRLPNSDDLGLDTVGIELDEHGFIRTDDVYATSAPGIWALGDVNGRGAFTHTAYQDYEILVDHLAGGPRSAAGRVTTYALFTDPPLGRVGITERQAAKYGRPVLSATYPMSRVARAVIDGEPHGFIKILVDADTDRFLGAAVLGSSGDEVVQVISALMQADVPAAALRTMLGIHPTVAELLPTALAGLAPLDNAPKSTQYGIAP